MQFRWIGWNRDHIAEHGVEPAEAEMVVRHARPPFPIKLEEDKWLVKAKGLAADSCRLFTSSTRTRPFSSFMLGLSPNVKRNSYERDGRHEDQETLEALLGNDHGRTP